MLQLNNKDFPVEGAWDHQYCAGAGAEGRVGERDRDNIYAGIDVRLL